MLPLLSLGLVDAIYFLSILQLKSVFFANNTRILMLDQQFLPTYQNLTLEQQRKKITDLISAVFNDQVWVLNDFSCNDVSTLPGWMLVYDNNTIADLVEEESDLFAHCDAWYVFVPKLEKFNRGIYYVSGRIIGQMILFIVDDLNLDMYFTCRILHDLAVCIKRFFIEFDIIIESSSFEFFEKGFNYSMSEYVLGGGYKQLKFNEPIHIATHTNIIKYFQKSWTHFDYQTIDYLYPKLKTESIGSVSDLSNLIIDYRNFISYF